MNPKASQKQNGKAKLKFRDDYSRRTNEIGFLILTILSMGIAMFFSEQSSTKLMTFLINNNDRFNDLFYNLQATSADNFFQEETRQYNNVYAVTTGFDYLYFKFLTLFGIDKYFSAFWMLLLIFSLFYTLFRISQNLVIVLTLIFSYPVFFTFFRGNQVLLMAILLGAFYLTFRQNKNIISSLLLGIMIAHAFPMMIYSAIYIVQRKFRFFVLSLTLSTVIHIWPIIFFGNSLTNNLEMYSKVNQGYINDYVIYDSGSKFNNSLFGMFKTILYLAHSRASGDFNEVLGLNRLLFMYYNFGVVLLLVLLYFIFAMKSKNFSIYFPKNAHLEEILLLLTILLIVLPHISADYKLVLLSVPLAALYQKSSDYMSWPIQLLFVILLIPKHFIVLEFISFSSVVTIQNLINPVIALILLIHLIMFISRGPRNNVDII